MQHGIHEAFVDECFEPARRFQNRSRVLRPRLEPDPAGRCAGCACRRPSPRVWDDPLPFACF
jgi:hypothetical protein